MAETLSGEGPFTIFAPTDRAFEQLPEGAVSTLLKDSNSSALKSVLGQHVVEGKELETQDLMGTTTEVSTTGGKTLTVDGTGQVVMIIPTGLRVSRVGDQVIVQREVATLTTPSMEVRTGSSESGNQQSGDQTEMRNAAGEGQAVDHAPAGATAVPSSQHQEQVTKEEVQGQQSQSPAQQQGGDQQAASGNGQQAKHESPQRTAMPSSEHQEMLVAEDELKGQQRQYDETARAQSGSSAGGSSSSGWQAGDPENRGALREAQVLAVNTEADNGVIYAIDRVLVPRDVLSKIETSKSQGQSQQSSQAESKKQQ